jgi:hypothetical protein
MILVILKVKILGLTYVALELLAYSVIGSRTWDGPMMIEDLECE